MKHRDFFFFGGGFFCFSLQLKQQGRLRCIYSVILVWVRNQVPLFSHLPHVSISAAAGFVSALYSISRSFVVLIVLYAFCFSAVKVSQKNNTEIIHSFKLEIDVISREASIVSSYIIVAYQDKLCKPRFSFCMLVTLKQTKTVAEILK